MKSKSLVYSCLALSPSPQLWPDSYKLLSSSSRSYSYNLQLGRQEEEVTNLENWRLSFLQHLLPSLIFELYCRPNPQLEASTPIHAVDHQYAVKHSFAVESLPHHHQLLDMATQTQSKYPKFSVTSPLTRPFPVLIHKRHSLG